MNGPYYQDESVILHFGDCLDVLRGLPDSSVDAVVTDPPYGIGFMGKEWDHKAIREAHEHDKANRKSLGPDSPSRPGRSAPRSSSAFGDAAIIAGPVTGGLPFQQWCQQWATEALRVLKPGGHMLAFGGTRTFHRLACAVEDAGFEIRDSIAWLYGSGFPKSLDVSKAIDKAAGADRDRLAPQTRLRASDSIHPTGFGADGWAMQSREAVTAAAAAWQGWGTALKPAFEPIVVARKPLAGTVAGNVLAHGTGALNIDACRVESSEADKRNHAAAAAAWAAHGERNGGTRLDGSTAKANEVYGVYGNEPSQPHDLGRWPANVVLDDSQAADLDRQSGTLTSGGGDRRSAGVRFDRHWQDETPRVHEGDSGGASRFFPTFRYESKAPTHERPRIGGGKGAIANQRCHACGQSRISGSRCECPEPQWEAQPETATAHPTVKPLDLMRWLVRLVTPPGGTVLDPFAGSGTTAEACILEGFSCIAIEREADYLALIVARLTKPLQPSLDLGGTA